ncbi:MAG: acyltransferase [bacterium]|nr:acyltransferase [bacterium]
MSKETGTVRLPCLDGLRALSIAIVLIGHFFFSGRGGGAALGVYIFFVISGFLITTLLFYEREKSGAVDVIGFYVRRIFRLFPVLALYVAAVISCAIFLKLDFSNLEIVSVALYFTNYYMSYLALHGSELVLPFGVLWSLAVEEHFYLFMPLVFSFVKTPKGVLKAAVLVVLFSLLVRVGYASFFPELSGKLLAYRNSETRFDSIAFGVALAAVFQLRSADFLANVFGMSWVFWSGVILMVIAGVVPGSYYKETIRFTIISVGALVVVAGAVFGKGDGVVFRFLNLSPVVLVGKMSYSLYIWHGGVDLFLSAFGGEVVEHSGIERLFLTFSLAYISFRYIETPMIALGRTFLKRRSSREAVA